MELDAAVFYPAITLLLTLLFFKALTGHLHSRRLFLNLPPGPLPLPVIGNLHLIGPLPHRSVHPLSKKYGEIMQLYFGSVPIVIGSSVEIARQFFKTHDQNFLSRPMTAAGRLTAYNYNNVTWAPHGPYWRHIRRISVEELLCSRRVDHYEYIRTEEIRDLVRGLYTPASVGKAVAIKDHLSTVGLNIICRLLFGVKYQGLQTSEGTLTVATAGSRGQVVSEKEMKEMVAELFFLSGVVHYADFIPWIEFLDLQGYVARMKAVSKKFDKFLEFVVEGHKARRQQVENHVPKNFVDVLLDAAEDPTLQEKLTLDGVKGIIQELIAGGVESAAASVEWGLSEMLRRPQTIETATRELDQVIGRERWVQESDIENLPYIKAIVKETLRMHPIASFLGPRECQKDCVVAGYDIPRGTEVLVNMWAVGRDPNVWDSPLEFYPERFIGTNIDVKGQDYELLPFGSGRRMCPGYNLGIKMIQSAFANILHGFDWKLPSEMKPENISMEESYGLSTHRKILLKVVPKLKMSTHLYH